MPYTRFHAILLNWIVFLFKTIKTRQKTVHLIQNHYSHIIPMNIG